MPNHSLHKVALAAMFTFAAALAHAGDLPDPRFTTASLVRTYIHPKEKWNELCSTFDVRLKGRDWTVRCSTGTPGADRD
jgi:hypothetical protein